MSLDVYLTIPLSEDEAITSIVFVRKNGQTVEITKEQWESKYPYKFVFDDLEESEKVYDANITHNLGQMASAAGIYQALWEPDEIGIKKARQLIEPLSIGLFKLTDNPEEFKKYNPENGWGSYHVLVRFVQNYIKACCQYPDADVSVWR